MTLIRLSAELKDQPIIRISDGKIIAKAKDVLIDPQTVTISALLFEEGSLFNRKTKLVPANAVQVWGDDVILVTGPGEIITKEQLPCHERCLSVANQIKGRTVVGTDGTRIGEVNDIVVNSEGQIVGYDLSRVFVQGPVAESKRIAVDATHALGPDVLVVDQTKLPQ